ncbi:hypothetical protein L1887_33234 [Cichorium endivia]|nr:hypothetical protein L1887_33234 [Cichorium endivia]
MNCITLDLDSRKGFQNCLLTIITLPYIKLGQARLVPRASVTAVAFGMGMFSGQKEGRHRPFAVITESRANDIMLRFHDCCQNYREITKNQESVQKLKQPVFDEITVLLAARYELNFTWNDISSLWFLCKQEASLFNITDQACGLFTEDEVNLLEWTDDMETFILRGYGNSLNYRMGVPLLEDVISSMEQAIIANKEGHAAGSYEKARLWFAHAETLVPFSCLIGLFIDEFGVENSFVELVVVAYLSCVLESAFTALEGLTKQSFLCELVNRVHKAVTAHWLKFSFNDRPLHDLIQ